MSFGSVIKEKDRVLGVGIIGGLIWFRGREVFIEDVVGVRVFEV